MSAFVRVQIQPLGYRRNGSPFYPIRGGSEAAADGGSGGDGGQDQAAQQQGSQQQQGAQQQAQQQSKQDDPQDVASLPDWAQKLIKDTRSEAAQHRTKASAAEQNQKQQMDAIAKALGLKGDEKADPEKLAADLQAKDSTIRSLTIKAALTDALATAGAKPFARAAIVGDGILNDLDPAADDFDSQVAAKVKEYIDKYPDLKAQAAGKAGTELNGGTGEHTSKTPLPMDQAVRATLGF